MRNKELISNVLSISCVENYFLGWGKELGIDCRKLFAKSYLSANEIITDFLYNGCKFESYIKIERVMETAERYLVTNHKCVTEIDFKLINENIDDSLVLIEVNQNFFKNKLTPWRADHYIWLTEKTKEGYKYLNNYPLSEGVISIEEVLKIFGGRMLVYGFCAATNYGHITRDVEAALDGLTNAENKKFELKEEINLQALRNAFGILKITRKRLAEFFYIISDEGLLLYNGEFKTFMDNYCNELNKFYAVTEAAILRKSFDLIKLQAMVDNIIFAENVLSDMVKKRKN